LQIKDSPRSHEAHEGKPKILRVLRGFVVKTNQGAWMRFRVHLAIVVIMLGGLANAEEPLGSQKAPAPYTPGLGDFMTAYVQPHHVKLGLAGREKNWKLAEYEADELKETFEDVTSYQGDWNKLPVAKLVETNITPALAAVADAVKHQSAPDFAKAFAKLSAACNACHQATDHSFIVIKPPAASSFPDQEFKP
jgi:hypothetical protein